MSGMASEVAPKRIVAIEHVEPLGETGELVFQNAAGQPRRPQLRTGVLALRVKRCVNKIRKRLLLGTHCNRAASAELIDAHPVGAGSVRGEDA